MSKKGKHSKKEKAKPKIDDKKIDYKILGIRISICVIITIGIIIYSQIMKNEQEVTEKTEQEVAEKTGEQKEEESIETASLEESVVEETNPGETAAEETNLEETVDTNVENLINQIMIENNLNENNFFFFYYNIEEKKYYFYNEDTYFTAASTIKVPVAMLYYDKINEGELIKYSDVELTEAFYDSNVVNVSYYYDVLQYLYQNADKYSELIEYMKISSNGGYLKANLPQYEVAHKYGSYDGYVHDYGIIYGQNTYLIGVFTKGIANGNDLIADIGEQVVACVETEKSQ